MGWDVLGVQFKRRWGVGFFGLVCAGYFHRCRFYALCLVCGLCDSWEGYRLQSRGLRWVMGWRVGGWVSVGFRVVREGWRGGVLLRVRGWWGGGGVMVVEDIKMGWVVRVGVIWW